MDFWRLLRGGCTIMTLKELSELTAIPYDTLRGWSSKKNDYRKNLVRFLKDSDRSILVKYFGKNVMDFKSHLRGDGL